MPSLEDLPFELLSEILTVAANLNLRDPGFTSYTYGVTQAPRPYQRNPKTEKYVRGRVPTDVLRWNAVNAFRRVNSRWHDWALSFALKELYVRRWRGGETWLKTVFETNTHSENLPVVYQHPYKAVRSTASLFHDYPQIAAHVRRVWFNGIYRFDTIDHVFRVLENCINVRSVSLPWTTVRYGDTSDWQRLTSFDRLRSLEFLSVGLRDETLSFPESHIDKGVLINAPGQLDFSRLRRFKLFGDSNVLPITDDDLIRIAGTATNLEEILISNIRSVTIRGVAALVQASKATLKLLDFTETQPSRAGPSSPDSNSDVHLCHLIASCPKLKDLAISLPACCLDLFNPPSQWEETVRLRLQRSGGDFAEIIRAARDLIERSGDPGLNIEISIGPYLFDTRGRTVHGNFRKLMREGVEDWAPKGVSVKGPYGATGVHDGETSIKSEWSCVDEGQFWDMVGVGFIPAVGA